MIINGTAVEFFEAAALLAQLSDDAFYRLAGVSGILDLTQTPLDLIRQAVLGQLKLAQAA